MDDAIGMSSLQCVGDLDGIVDSILEIEWTILQLILERLTFDILHDDELLTFVLLNVIDHTDIGMFDSRGCFGFLEEPGFVLF